MNNTRKSIIELIEHYMDKINKPQNNSDLFWEYQLVEWVLNNWFNWYYKNDLIEYVKEWLYLNEKILNSEDFLEWKTDYLIYSIYFKYWEWLFWNTTPKIIKRFWHYDITAVIKMIKNSWYYILPQWFDKIYFRNDEIDKEIEIPNKPINIYSKEEEKELLEILINIK